MGTLRMRRSTRRSTVALVAAIGLFAVACGGGGAEEPAAEAPAAEEPAAEAPADLTEITVLLPNPSALNVFNLCVAIGEGYLAEEGLAVTVEAVDGSGAVMQAMVAGQAQIGLPGPGPLLLARERGEDLRHFYNQFAQSLFGLVVPADSGFTSFEELRGQVIGVGTADGTEVGFARGILAAQGLEEGTDYTFLPVGDGGPATAAFERGDIVAYSAAIPDMAIMEARGLALEEITPDEFLARFGNGWAATGEYLEANPDVIQGFVRALLRGTEFANANKDATLAHCAAVNPEEGSDGDLASALYDAVIARAEPLPGGTLGAFPLEGWEAWQQILIDGGDLPGPVDLESAFTNAFVEGA